MSHITVNAHADSHHTARRPCLRSAVGCGTTKVSGGEATVETESLHGQRPSPFRAE